MKHSTLPKSKQNSILKSVQEINPKNCWKFAKIENIEEKIFNPLLQTFFKNGLEALVRENIQNSLDAKLENTDSPVIVKISIGSMKSSDIPGIEHIRSRINCLQAGNEYITKTIKYMKSNMDKQNINFMSFEDVNTKGLSEETWKIYAYQKGTHYIENNENIENIRGGSHGVGKIASNAASDIHMMFFANCDENQLQNLGGTIQLIEHKYGCQCFRSTGYFTGKNKMKEFVPYKNISNPIFQKNTRGLKIIIPFLRKQYNNSNDIVRAVCDNFFVAILESKLIVHVNDIIIDKKTILEISKGPNFYSEQELKKNLTPLYIDSYLSQVPIKLKVKDKSHEYYFSLYFKYHENIKTGRIAIIRTIGMKIEDFKVKHHSKTPFNAVIIPGSQKEDVFLKSLENESHTKISAGNIRDEKIKKNAIWFINNLHKTMGDYISKIKKKYNPTDGTIDTSDLIYSIENKFRKQLSENTPTVLITPFGKSTKSLIVKQNINRKRRLNSEVINTSRDKPKTSKKTNINGTDKEKNIKASPLDFNQVKRIIADNTEHLLLNIQKSPNYSGQNKCNIHIKIVDGQGNISNEKLDLSKYYSQVKDMQNNYECKMQDNRILNISINKGNLSLKMHIGSKSNQTLKFIYFVEVAM